jgi:uncharacterized protein with GYD domain
MAKYAIFFTLKGESISHGMDHPSDRSEVMGKFAAAAGGKLEAYYWMLGGAYDGFVIVEMPDSAAVAAVSLAVSSSGAVGHLATHELFDSKQVSGVLAKAKGLKGHYSPP